MSTEEIIARGQALLAQQAAVAGGGKPAMGAPPEGVEPVEPPESPEMQAINQIGSMVQQLLDQVGQLTQLMQGPTPSPAMAAPSGMVAP